MATYFIPGALSQNNLGITSLVGSDPTSSIEVHKGVPAYATVYMDSIELVPESHPGQLFNDVVAIMRGHVMELSCPAFPGNADGDVTVVKFNPGSVVEHVRGDDVEEEVVEDLSDAPSVNDAAPYYEMHYHFSREQLYNISAKGGFVPGYADYAVPSNILRRPWESIPVKVDVSEMRIGHLCPKCGHPVSADETECPKCGMPSRGSSLFFFEIEDAACAHVDARIGYVLDELLVTSPEMTAHPERVVGVDRSLQDEVPEMMSREEVITEAMLDFEDEFDDMLDVENDIEAPSVDVESTGRADERIDPRESMFLDSRAKQDALDAAAIEAILSGGSAIDVVEGRMAEQVAQAAAEEAPQQAQAAPETSEAGAEDNLMAAGAEMQSENRPATPQDETPVTVGADMSDDSLVFGADADLDGDGVITATERKIMEKRRARREQRVSSEAAQAAAAAPKPEVPATSSKSADDDLFNF